MRILVCDDNRDAAETLAALCLMHFPNDLVEVCYRGDACIEKARTWIPDVLLLDIGMPGADGYTVAAALRKLKACCNTFIIAISGWAAKADRAKSAAAGIDVHLAKPIIGEHLFDLIRSRQASIPVKCPCLRPAEAASTSRGRRSS